MLTKWDYLNKTETRTTMLLVTFWLLIARDHVSNVVILEKLARETENVLKAEMTQERIGKTSA